MYYFKRGDYLTCYTVAYPRVFWSGLRIEKRRSKILGEPILSTSDIES